MTNELRPDKELIMVSDHFTIETASMLSIKEAKRVAELIPVAIEECKAKMAAWKVSRIEKLRQQIADMEASE